uniref:Uncharacterized protein n=1 Tax=Rhizophora mucronata TaxID=61149 RepID=A0A2P2QGQ2_RHIMU
MILLVCLSLSQTINPQKNPKNHGYPLVNCNQN